mmetsp:Transcript_15140/g.24695  ORF Transcript_15140/g.24695 Transcript_15140/m.24695 type:complete len:122 (+) Transcript_15140:662-1027(+)
MCSGAFRTLMGTHTGVGASIRLRSVTVAIVMMRGTITMNIITTIIITTIITTPTMRRIIKSTAVTLAMGMVMERHQTQSKASRRISRGIEAIATTPPMAHITGMHMEVCAKAEGYRRLWYM